VSSSVWYQDISYESSGTLQVLGWSVYGFGLLSTDAIRGQVNMLDSLLFSFSCSWTVFAEPTVLLGRLLLKRKIVGIWVGDLVCKSVQVGCWGRLHQDMLSTQNQHNTARLIEQCFAAQTDNGPKHSEWSSQSIDPNPVQLHFSLRQN